MNYNVLGLCSILSGLGNIVVDFMFRVTAAVQFSLITYLSNKVTFGYEGITTETIMILHLTRVDDVICLKIFHFCL